MRDDPTTPLSEGVDINDPDYRLGALIFNAITEHPDVDLLLSGRRRVADAAVKAVWRQMRREHRRRWWFQFRWVRVVRTWWIEERLLP